MYAGEARPARQAVAARYVADWRVPEGAVSLAVASFVIAVWQGDSLERVGSKFADERDHRAVQLSHGLSRPLTPPRTANIKHTYTTI